MQFSFFSSNWDFWYASQCSVGLLFLFPSSTSVSLLLIAGASSTIFDVAPSAPKLTNPSTDHVPRTFSTLFSSKSISSNCQIHLMTYLHRMTLHSNPHWLTFSLNLLDSLPLYYNVIMRRMSNKGTENPGFCYWVLSFNNIAIMLRQYFTNNLNINASYSCQHAWGTLQLG